MKFIFILHRDVISLRGSGTYCGAEAGWGEGSNTIFLTSIFSFRIKYFSLLPPPPLTPLSSIATGTWIEKQFHRIFETLRYSSIVKRKTRGRSDRWTENEKSLCSSSAALHRHISRTTLASHVRSNWRSQKWVAPTSIQLPFTFLVADPRMLGGQSPCLPWGVLLTQSAF